MALANEASKMAAPADSARTGVVRPSASWPYMNHFLAVGAAVAAHPSG